MTISQLTKEREQKLLEKLSIYLEKLDSFDTVEVGLRNIRHLFVKYPKRKDIKLILNKLIKVISK